MVGVDVWVFCVGDGWVLFDCDCRDFFCVFGDVWDGVILFGVCEWFGVGVVVWVVLWLG